MRSILAILGGYAAMAVVVIAGTVGLQAIQPAWFQEGAPPVPPYLATNIAYSLIAALLGGFVTASIAARKPVQHTLSLGIFMMIMSVVSALTAEDRQPRWYQVLIGIVMPLAAILGGWLRARRHSPSGLPASRTV